MRKLLKMKPLVIFALFLVLFSCRPPAQEEGGDEEVFGAAPVRVVRVKKQKISEKLFYTGTIEPWQKVNITPDVGGKVAKIYVEEGDRVKEGQVLAELDTRAIRLQLKQTEAGLAVAEANYKDAERNMERMDRLIDEKAVSDQQYEKIKLAFEAAEAQLKQAQAALNLAQYNLDVSIMKAPFSGVVASKNVDVGDVINPMMGSLSPNSGVLTLMNFYQVKIAIDVSQKDIVRIKKGQSAYLGVTAFPGREFKGYVALVNQTADSMTKKFKVEVRADNQDLFLRPNTFGEVIIEVSTHEEAIAVPQKSVLEDKYVFVAQGNIAEKREVTLGLQNADLVEIASGIKEGELVIIEGNYGLEDGAEIRIEEEKR